MLLSLRGIDGAGSRMMEQFSTTICSGAHRSSLHLRLLALFLFLFAISLTAMSPDVLAGQTNTERTDRDEPSRKVSLEIPQAAHSPEQ